MSKGPSCEKEKHLTDQIKCDINQNIKEQGEKEKNQPKENGKNRPKSPDPEYKLKIISEDIVSFSGDEDSIPIIVEIQNKSESIVPEKNYVPITLEFSSKEGAEYFTVLPRERSLSVGGKSTFYLKQNKKDLGVNMTIKATSPHVDIEDSEEIPVIVSPYNFETLIEEKVLIAGEDGIRIQLKVLNTEEEIQTKIENKTLALKVVGSGRIESGNNLKLQEGVGEFIFLPGTKSGITYIQINDPALLITPTVIPLEILPGPPVDLETRSSSPVLLDDETIELNVALIDQYKNPIFAIRHDIEWKLKNFKVIEESKLDSDSRASGVQQNNVRGVGAIYVRPIDWDRNASFEVTSNYLPEISKKIELEPLQKTRITHTISSNSVVAGSPSPVRVKIRAYDVNNKILKIDNPIFIQQSPAEFGNFPSNLVFKDGVALFEFYPKTIAGNFTLSLNSPGIGAVDISFVIEPGSAEKIEMIPVSQSYDAGSVIQLDFSIKDDYQNTVSSFDGEIIIKASDQTKYIVSESEKIVLLQKGKGRMTMKTSGKRGMLHLYAEGRNLIGDTLEIPVLLHYPVSKFGAFNPKSLLTIVEQENGIWDPENKLVHELLLEGKTQAVGTTLNQKNPQKQYGVIDPSGAISDRFDIELVEQSFPTVLLSQNKTPLSLLRIIPSSNEIFLNKERNKSGIYIDALKDQIFDLSINKKIIEYKSIPILQIRENGSLKNLNQKLKIKHSVPSNILKWELYYDGVPLGIIEYYGKDVILEPSENFSSKKEKESLTLTSQKLYKIVSTLILEFFSEEEQIDAFYFFTAQVADPSAPRE